MYTTYQVLFNDRPLKFIQKEDKTTVIAVNDRAIGTEFRSPEEAFKSLLEVEGVNIAIEKTTFKKTTVFKYPEFIEKEM